MSRACALGLIEQRIHACEEGRLAELLHHGQHLALARGQSADQRLDIPDIEVGFAHIRAHDAQDLLVEHPLTHELHRRKADALLMDLR